MPPPDIGIVGRLILKLKFTDDRLTGGWIPEADIQRQAGWWDARHSHPGFQGTQGAITISFDI